MPDGFESPFDDTTPSRPLPPDDRLWRHPSEVGGAVAAAPTTTRARVAGGLLTGAGVALVVVGALAVASWLDERSTVTTARSVPIETHMVLVASSTTTTPTPLRPGWLGVSAANAEDGVQVTACDDGSPASKVLQVGDVILAFDARPVGKLADLVALLDHSKAGSLAQIRVQRHGTNQVVSVRLASRH